MVPQLVFCIIMIGLSITNAFASNVPSTTLQIKRKRLPGRSHGNLHVGTVPMREIAITKVKRPTRPSVKDVVTTEERESDRPCDSSC